MNTLEFEITGMVCQGCSQGVERMAVSLAGVSGAVVDHETGTASVTCDPSVEPDAVYEAIRDGGFGVRACGNPACACDDCHCSPCACC